MSSEIPSESAPPALPLPISLPAFPEIPIASEAGSFAPPLTHFATPFPVKAPKPAPGILISFCWFLALIGAQIAFAIVGIIVLIAMAAASGEPVDFAKLDETKWGGLILLASSQFATAFTALVAAFVHARKNYVERLQLALPRARHWAFGLLAVIPVSILSTEAAVIMGQVDGFSLKYLEESVKGINAIPFPAVLLFGCVFPGLFEELLFRSVMGRGMTQRNGLWIGIGFASLFFGMAHIVPAHLVGAGVIGVFLHLAFINSRSFWVPVSMHVVNNAMAFTLSRYQELLPIPGYTSELGGDEVVHASPQLLATAFFATLVLFVCWRHFRSPPLFEGQPVSAIESPRKPSVGLGWLLAIGVLLTQAFLVMALVSSIAKA